MRVGALRESVETKTVVRKGEKRPQKIKRLLYGVNWGTGNGAVQTSRQERNMAGGRVSCGYRSSEDAAAVTLPREAWQRLVRDRQPKTPKGVEKVWVRLGGTGFHPGSAHTCWGVQGPSVLSYGTRQ